MVSPWRMKYKSLINHKWESTEWEYIRWLEGELDIIKRIAKGKGTASYKLTRVRAALKIGE